VVSLLAETRVFNKNQGFISLSEDASHRGPSNSRQTRFLAKFVQSVSYTTVSSMKLTSVRYRFATYAYWQFTHFRNNCTNICRFFSSNCNYRVLPL